MQISDLLDLGVLDLIRLCRIVYESDVEADNQARLLEYRPICHIGNGGPHAMVVEDERRIIIVVRGTEVTDPWDVLADFRFLPRQCRLTEKTTIAPTIKTAGRVHRGFDMHAQGLWDELPLRVLESPKQLWVCGHSLGGAAATILSVAIADHRKKRRAKLGRPHLLTIGAPQVGTPAFMRQVRKSTNTIYRFVNHRDPIPLMACMYQHPKSLNVRFNGCGGPVINPVIWDRIRDRARGWKGAVPVFFKTGFKEGSLPAAITAAVLHVLPLKFHKADQYVDLMQAQADLSEKRKQVA